ncbi:hypothetical protein [Streptomyces sp. CBMA123]|uniref:hypothetical protein n=1 Tax=Streptomyces sp. CBMA123 TaxID=1896313 RepID=UPI001661921E|nr:hypothetical protein [Streptomyces sp. CBMA123]MBD0690288.1 hypothetical protein [Streptomyces sp. CBMA123]
MVKGILRKIGRRGGIAVATLALAGAGIGLSAGDANAVGWYYLNNHPTGHGVGVYSAPYSWSGKVAGDLGSYSWSGDAVNMVCWTTGENINNQGDVWYRVVQVYSAGYGYWPSSGTSVAYVYGAYTDGNWNFHVPTIPPC